MEMNNLDTDIPLSWKSVEVMSRAPAFGKRFRNAIIASRMLSTV